MKQTNKRAIKQPIRMILLFFGIVLLCTALFSLRAEATVSSSGICGENLTWTVEDTTLTISGTGPMYDYSEENPAPWYANRFSLRTFHIEEGITKIGDYAFYQQLFSGSVILPKSITKVGSKAFGEANGLIYFLGDAPDFAVDAMEAMNANACYFLDWDPAVLQSYGGSFRWYKGYLYLKADEKRFYELNEPLSADTLPLYASYSNTGDREFSYTTQSLQISDYDNSTYGQKRVTLTADGTEIVYDYIVTDGQNHFDLIEIKCDRMVEYVRGKDAPRPVVNIGQMALNADKHYTLTREGEYKGGQIIRYTVTGKGIFAGFTRTVEVAVLKSDLSKATVSIENQGFWGEPLYPEAEVAVNGGTLSSSDYEVMGDNNTNVGTATAYIVGKNSYYGIAKKQFSIKKQATDVALPWAYVGTEGGTMDGEIPIAEGWLTPGKFTGYIDTRNSLTLANHRVNYELYRIDGDKQVKIKTRKTGYYPEEDTSFTYDFSSVYDKNVDEGYQTYVLAYSIEGPSQKIYGGGCILYVPTKVPTATEMDLYMAQDDGDFRADYIGAYGVDGNLGVPTWKVSDTSVATIESNGKLTFKRPGTVTITGTVGKLSASGDLTMSVLNIAEGTIFDYDAATGVANVIYDGRILIPGTDYTLTATTNGDVTEVLVAGCGLFEGYILRQFDAEGEPVAHTHSFDTVCDETCGSCDFTRVTQHTFRDRWMKDETAHWHSCSVCGKQKDHETHTLSDAQTCTVCGPLREPGDVDADGDADTDDAVYLLLHVMFGDEDYPVGDGVLTDFNDDSKLDTDDAVYLLLHVMFGQEDYPLPA